MRKITQKQKEILDRIIQIKRDIGYPPTMQELANEFGFKSKNAVYKHLEALEKKGFIRRAANGARGITILQGVEEDGDMKSRGVPLVGLVAAGTPITAEQNIERYVPVPEYLTDSAAKHYALRVQGDSMIDAGILEGDLVIVRSTNHADNGDIVVALSEEEATVKRFVVKNERLKYLKPENTLYGNIPITEGWSIQGKVVALIREHI